VSGPDPAVAAVRNAVRAGLSDLEPGDLVLVACSGGADSLALAAATAFVSVRSEAGYRSGAITVDHGLQAGSAERADALAERLRGIGLDPVLVVRVEVGNDGGPEAAARTARYEALDDAAARLGARAVLLAHTSDDQAETVLLGLARGSGARSLAGMAPISGVYRRPVLGLTRAVLRRACVAHGLEPWDDPHNADPRFTRVRIRVDALPALERAVGPGVAAALARTADLLRADCAALDEWAVTGLEAARATKGPGAAAGGLDVAVLAELPEAVRTRVIRLAALEAGCPAGSLFGSHLHAVDALVIDWHGQDGVDLPGGLRARRACDRLWIGSGEGREE